MIYKDDNGSHIFQNLFNQCIVVEIVTKKTNVLVFFFPWDIKKIAKGIVHRDFQKVICHRQKEDQLVNAENDHR